MRKSARLPVAKVTIPGLATARVAITLSVLALVLATFLSGCGAITHVHNGDVVVNVGSVAPVCDLFTVEPGSTIPQGC